MEMLMCRSCGEFVAAVESDGTFEPIYSQCPECGGTSFKHNATGQIIEVR